MKERSNFYKLKNKKNRSSITQWYGIHLTNKTHFIEFFLTKNISKLARILCEKAITLMIFSIPFESR